MTRPPTLEDFDIRSLAQEKSAAIHTFSNSDDYTGWADDNCFDCQFYEIDGSCGEHCVFEAALLLGLVSPELARLFGWTQDPAYEGPHGWDPPRRCPWFVDRAAAQAPFDDPQQISLLDGGRP